VRAARAPNGSRRAAFLALRVRTSRAHWPHGYT